MTNDERMTKPEEELLVLACARADSTFVIRASFVIRHSSFIPPSSFIRPSSPNREWPMGTFVVCYLIVWTASMVYVAHLGTNQIRLRQSLDRLQQQVDRRQQTGHGAARAA
jgi:hypothetical protein